MLGLQLRCLDLDRGFYTGEVLRFLLQHDLPFALAAPKKGKQGGSKAWWNSRGQASIPISSGVPPREQWR